MSPERGFIAAFVVTACMLTGAAASAQIVQLPSFQTFSYTGSISVPDSGAGYLGGNRSSAVGRGFSATLDSTLSAHATILDLEAMDRQIRGVDPSRAPARLDRQASGVDPIEEAKALVRFARTCREAGRDAQACAAYEMAIDTLDRVALANTKSSSPPAPLPGAGRGEPVSAKPSQLANDPKRLARLARAEFVAAYPDQRRSAMPGDVMGRWPQR